MLRGLATVLVLAGAVACSGNAPVTPFDGGASLDGGPLLDGGLAADGGGEDGGGADGGGEDGGTCVPDPDLPDGGEIPPVLSATGLYADIVTKTVAEGVAEFHPAHVLWSDGAEKSRWVRLPRCTQIDTADMDHWVLPVGTQFWKEFRIGGRRIETRLIQRFGAGATDFFFAAYQWDDTETEATHVPLGVQNAGGTEHDIPAQADCVTCHGYLPERALGFSAIQLSHSESGVNLGTLRAEGRLTVPGAAAYTIPGDEKTARALGYMHANCGQCHNPNGIVFLNPFQLRLLVSETEVAMTGPYRTAVGVPVEKFAHPGITHRVAPGNVAASCVPYRMSVRHSLEQMPPLATEVVDTDGLTIVREWIQSMANDGGGP